MRTLINDIRERNPGAFRRFWWRVWPWGVGLATLFLATVALDVRMTDRAMNVLLVGGIAAMAWVKVIVTLLSTERWTRQGRCLLAEHIGLALFASAIVVNNATDLHRWLWLLSRDLFLTAMVAVLLSLDWSRIVARVRDQTRHGEGRADTS